MALRLKRGTTSELAGYTPLEGELVYDTDTKSLYVGDGSLAGGKLLSSGLTLIDDLVLGGNDITGTGNINITGNIHATGNITSDGDITIGNGDLTDNVVFNSSVSSNFVPDANGTRDLGAESYKWGTLHVNDVSATNVTGNTFGYHTGDMEGSVFADNSTMLVDGVAGRIVGPVYSNVNGNVIGDVVSATTSGVVLDTSASVAVFTGNVTGDLTGDVTGTFTGFLKSSSGEIVLDTGSTDTLEMRGNVIGDLTGSVYSVNSTRLIDATNGSIELDGTVQGNIIPDVTSTHNLGSSELRFNRAYIQDKVYIAGVNLRVEDDQLSVKGGVANRLPVSTTLNGAIPSGSRTTFTVASTDGILPGAVFSLPGVSEAEVLTASAGTVTTVSSFTAAGGGGGDGAAVTFYNPPVPTLSFVNSAPTGTPTNDIGSLGDKKGMVYADASYVYICYDDYNGITPIWARTASSW